MIVSMMAMLAGVSAESGNVPEDEAVAFDATVVLEASVGCVCGGLGRLRARGGVLSRSGANSSSESMMRMDVTLSTADSAASWTRLNKTLILFAFSACTCASYV